MYKIKFKINPIFAAFYIILNVGLIIAIFWLAAKADKTIVWIFAIGIDIIVAWMAYSTFRSLLKPKEFLKPLPKPLVYKEQERKKKALKEEIPSEQEEVVQQEQEKDI